MRCPACDGLVFIYTARAPLLEAQLLSETTEPPDPGSVESACPACGVALYVRNVPAQDK